MEKQIILENKNKNINKKKKVKYILEANLFYMLDCWILKYITLVFSSKGYGAKK